MNKNDARNLKSIIDAARSQKPVINQDAGYYGSLGGVSQLREADISAKAFADYFPTKFNTNLLSFIRESIPICDRAIRLDKMLFGDFDIVFDDKNKQLEQDMAEWKKTCRVNYLESDLINWAKQMLDSAREFGGGIGETILNKTLTDIACLRVGDVRQIRFAKNKQTNDLMIVQTDIGKSIPFPHQDLIHYLGVDYRQGNPYGYPLFWGVPFVANIFSRILKCIENQVVRLGDPIFVIILECGENVKQSDAKEAINSIKANWMEAQKAKKMGKYTDIFNVAPPGSVYNIKIAGGDIEIPDLEIPTRTILEQMSLASDYPTFLLNLHMGDNYNITTHQNDLIVTKTNDMRERTEPILRKNIDIKLALMRRTGIPYQLKWNDVNLQDEKVTAEVKKLEAEALKIETDTRLSLLELSLISGDSVTKWAIDKGIEKNVSNSDIERGILGRLQQTRYANQLQGSSLKLMRKLFDGIPKETRRITAGYIQQA
jgi:hypothetical protein